MQGLAFPFCVHVTGTLAADVKSIFQAPVSLSLVKVSAASSVACNAKLKIGTLASDAAYMALKDISNSGSPAVFDRDDFVGTQYPHIDAGTNVIFTLDFDGSSGSAAQDYQLVAYFAEG